MPELHLLRPLWLLGLIPVAVTYVLMLRAEDVTRSWRGVIAPHLLAHLVVGGTRRRRLRPRHVIPATLALACLALAGPAWRREPNPFAQDTATLIVCLELTPGMHAVDVQPTRLARGKQKVRDLLALRAGARTGLVAYAGSAHLVVPPTEDPAVLETFLAALEPDLMPAAGEAPLTALALAEALLASEEPAGTVLFVSDGIAAEHASGFAAWSARTGDQALVLAVGTERGGPVREGEDFLHDASGSRVQARLDRAGLDALDRVGVPVVDSSVGPDDVASLQRRVQSHLEAAQEDDPGARWQDDGYLLVWPVALGVLGWFRRGWQLRWAG